MNITLKLLKLAIITLTLSNTFGCSSKKEVTPPSDAIISDVYKQAAIQQAAIKQDKQAHRGVIDTCNYTSGNKPNELYSQVSIDLKNKTYIYSDKYKTNTYKVTDVPERMLNYDIDRYGFVEVFVREVEGGGLYKNVSYTKGKIDHIQSFVFDDTKGGIYNFSENIIICD